MIYGIGIDGVKVARMAKSLQRPGFAARVFSREEQSLIAAIAAEAKRNETAAANFAAKEAFLKAAGLGLGGFALAEVAALRKADGRPYYAFSGKAAAWIEKEGLAAHLSLSHEDGLALAVAVLEVR